MDKETKSQHSSSDSEDDDFEDQECLQQVQKYSEQIQSNELNYDAHVGLISAWRKLGKFEKVRNAREHLNRIYPLSPGLWLEWLTDEQKIFTQKDDQQYITTLFEKAVYEYTSVKVWVEYIMFMLGCGNWSDTRNVCEKALMAVGIHLAEGVLIWQAVLLVEQQYFASLQSENKGEKVEEQYRRIQNLYRRQARVPLMNLDKIAFLNEAANWFPNEEVDSQTKSDLDKSFGRMEAKIPFEEALLRAEDETAKLEAYRRYIDEVRLDSNPAVIQNIYERTITELCLNAGLWEEYVKFLIEQFPSAEYVVLPVCKRSQTNCPWSGALCDLHITSLERFSSQLGEKEAEVRIKEALQKMVSSGVSVGDELVKAWLSYLVYLRRKIIWEEDHEVELNNFRSACQQAMEFIDERCGEEGDIDSTIARFQARIEAESAKNIEGMRKIWNDNIMKRNKNSKNPNFWLEFINLERSFGSGGYCRKLFRRALERVWEFIEVIGQAFLQFERELGTLDTVTDFENRYRDRLSVVQKKRLEDAAKEELTQQQEKMKKKKYVPPASSKASLVTDFEFKKPFPLPSSSKGFDTKKTPLLQAKKRPAEDEATNFVKKTKGDTVHGEFIKHNPGLDSMTVFLSNMNYNSEDKDILPIFSDCGEIDSLRITRDYKGRSKGFGYLVFKSKASVQKALKLDRTPVSGRPLFVSPCNPKERDNTFKYATGREREKLFIRGLPFTMTEEEIKEAFQPHGDIKSLRLITHRNGHSKGNCYIEYHDAATAENVRAKMDGMILQDFKIQVVISNPSASRVKPTPSRSRPFHEPVPGPSSGGTQRPKLSLIPRALQRKSENDSNTEREPVINGSANDPAKPKSNEDFRKMLLK